MGKLHEILAVEGGKKAAAEKVRNEAEAAFKNKRHLFGAFEKTLNLFAPEEGQPASEIVEEQVMTTTVPCKLNWVANFLAEYLDVNFQKDLTNQEATADLDIEGFVVNAPVTFLLSLEKNLIRFRELLDSTPTLPPGIDWRTDGSHKFQMVRKSATPERTTKTTKIIKPFVLYKATDKHPAQVEKLTENIPIGTFEKVQWTGELSPAEKAGVLKRCDKMIEEVKKARMRANDTSVKEAFIGEKLLRHILGPEIVDCGLGIEKEL